MKIVTKEVQQNDKNYTWVFLDTGETLRHYGTELTGSIDLFHLIKHAEEYLKVGEQIEKRN